MDVKMDFSHVFHPTLYNQNAFGRIIQKKIVLQNIFSKGHQCKVKLQDHCQLKQTCERMQNKTGVRSTHPHPFNTID